MVRINNEKLQETLNLLSETGSKISQNGENWEGFLDTASRMYVVPSFLNQVLIHAQRPDATICAPIGEWNKESRYVKKGTGGIKQIGIKGNGEQHVNYLFDVNDTYVTSREQQNLFSLTAQQQWEIRDEQKEDVISALSDRYSKLNTSSALNTENLRECVESIAKNFATRYSSNAVNEVNTGKLLHASVTYVVMARCGEKAEEFSEIFSGISDIPRAEVKNLGMALNKISRDILKTIERTVERGEQYERRAGREAAAFQGRERDSLHTGGRLLSAGHDRPNREKDNGEIQDRAGALPVESQAGYIPPVRGGGEAVETLGEDRGRSRGHERADNETDAGSQSDTSKPQEDGSVEVGGADDQLRRFGYRDSNAGSDLSGGLAGGNGRAGAAGNQSGGSVQGVHAGRAGNVGRVLSGNAGRRVTGSLFSTEEQYTASKPSTENDINLFSVNNAEPLSLEETLEEMKKRSLEIREQAIARNAMPVEDARLNEAISNLEREIEGERNKTVIDKQDTGDIANRPGDDTNESSAQSRINFRITDDNLGVGGAKTKYNFNATAIKLLKQIESENRFATSVEQETLSRYVGWGGIPQAFDKDKSDWGKEYEELKTLLTDDEYESARASTLNAHYTSPTVIKSVYKAIEKMGFSKGNILEPSCGVGNFFGLLPESMSESKLYGVELDGITGRIAKQLYQNADIMVSGYEKTSFPDNFFDVAVGNVPFGDYKVQDNKYDKHNFRIHDYFFAKTLDQVRPGGVVAFVTSKGTLDKANPGVRKYLAQRAELIGAIRLPNNAFTANAGTEVTTDVIFLQKRERQIDIEPDWVHLNKTTDGIPVNGYFADNPHMILGKMVMGINNSMYGNDNETACIPDTDKGTLAEQMERAISHINAKFIEQDNKIIEDEKDLLVSSIPADPNARNFSYTLVDGELYYRNNSIMEKPEMSSAAIERAKGLVQLRDCARELIDCQLYNHSDKEIGEKQTELNDLYDRFTARFGMINSRENEKAFKGDSSYHLLCSLEDVDENKQAHKTDMFYKRTIKQKSVITSVDTAVEALAVSLAERAKVDIQFMSNLTKSDGEQIISELQGIIFQNPEKKDGNDKFAGYEAADEYLSGNIREKLIIAQQAAENDESYNINVQALEKSMPKALTAAEIDVRLGATWVSPKYIEDFMIETFDTPSRKIRYEEIKASYHDKTSEWNVDGKSRDYLNVKANVTYGTSRANAYKILEETLNLRDVRIFDTEIDSEGKKKQVLNKKETALAQQKQEYMKQTFKDWIFKDQERRDTLVQIYNERFNSTKPREYDGGHLEFPGINPEIHLKKHQRDAIARIMYGGNTLLAHTVGAGKTFEMIASAMESKRLGLCQKSLFVVPNHLTEQTATEFMRLYPSANILVATKEMFETNNRKKFCSRIATGDYDAVIIGHSQFEKIPISKERQSRLLKEQIDEIAEAADDLRRQKGNKFSIKQLEKTKRNLGTRLAKLYDTKRKDDVVTFEELGVDRVFVDEAHYYKNLFLMTKMRNIAGIPQVEAQKSSDLYLKCRYMDEITGGKGIIFATGTPVSNSMTELFTMKRYLQHDKLEKQGLGNFDSWASTFGETVTAIELAPEGTGYRARTRFAKFYNLPELMRMFKEVADIQTADMLKLPVPKAEFHTIVAKPSEYQKAMVDELSERADLVQRRLVEPYEDNMLKITTDGRKIGLDQRLINPMLPDDENSKVNKCANNIYEIWENTKDNKLTQLMFCDFSTPNNDGRFNVYDDIKGKLIQKGIPAKEIAFIHDANTEEQKDDLFEKVRNGQVRVLMGSTAKMGSGTNVQKLLAAIHELDCPWRPADIEQREGRIIRQGNTNESVNIYRYVTENTFDAYTWQIVEGKQKFISQIMTSKNPSRTCADADQTVLSYAEVKALCIGDERIREKMDLDIDVAKLRMLKTEHQNTLYGLEDRLNKTLPREISQSQSKIAHYETDIAQVKATHTEEFSSMTVKGKVFVGKDEKSNAGEAIIDICRNDSGSLSLYGMTIGEYRGFKMELSFNAFKKEFELALKGAGTHRIALGDSPIGNMTRIENALNGIAEKLESEKTHLDSLYKQIDNVKEEIAKPFPREEELAGKSARLDELNIALNLDKSQNENIDGIEADEGNDEIPNAEESVTENIKEEKANIIKEAKNLLGKHAIISNPTKNSETYGKVLVSSEHYLVQETPVGNGIVHEREKIPSWDWSGDTNNEVTIKYDNGFGKVTEKTLEESHEELVCNEM